MFSLSSLHQLATCRVRCPAQRLLFHLPAFPQPLPALSMGEAKKKATQEGAAEVCLPASKIGEGNEGRRAGLVM